MPRHSGQKRLVSVADAADYVGLTTRTIYRYIADGRLTGYRVGPKLIRVDLDELDRMIRPIPAAPLRA